jgi:hypothetical protein
VPFFFLICFLFKNAVSIEAISSLDQEMINGYRLLLERELGGETEVLEKKNLPHHYFSITNSK